MEFFFKFLLLFHIWKKKTFLKNPNTYKNIMLGYEFKNFNQKQNKIDI